MRADLSGLTLKLHLVVPYWLPTCLSVFFFSQSVCLSEFIVYSTF